MTAALSSARPRLVLMAIVFGALLGCSDDEVILPGEREPIRPEDQLAAASVVEQTDVEGSRAISLPSQSANAEWAQGHGTAAFRTAHPAFGSNPQLIWRNPIGAGDSRKLRITADPIVGGGRIYTLDANALVTATTLGGATIWARDVRPARDSEGDATGGGMAFNNGTLYVSSGFGIITALDAATGATRWTQELDATGSGNPLVSNGLVYLVAGDDTGWAIEADSGRIAWQLTATPSVTNVLGAPAPVLSNGLAVFAFGSGDLIATFPKGGLRRWTATVAGQRLGRSSARFLDITGAPVAVGSTIFAGNHSGRIVAFDANSGSRRWTAAEGATDPVWPVGGSIFAITDRNELLRLDASNGVIIWRVQLPGYIEDRPRRRDEIFANHGPVVAGGRVVVASNDGLLRYFSPQDGSLLGTTSVPGGATTAPVFAGGVLYVVSVDGELLAFR